MIIRDALSRDLPGIDVLIDAAYAEYAPSLSLAGGIG